MPKTIPFTEQLSETWLLERTYHAYMHDGKELSVPDFTHALKAITNLYVPCSIWEEISPDEASALYQQGTPVLLYSGQSWKHPKKGPGTWSVSKNMSALIFGSVSVHPEDAAGVDDALCYLDLQRGNAANYVWKRWFSSDPAMLLGGNASRTMTFLAPRLQFPSTIHYTVIAADGHSIEYTDPAAAILGFQTCPPEEEGTGGELQIVFPQLCYYCDVTCPDGVYRLEFFGPRMNEHGYRLKEA